MEGVAFNKSSNRKTGSTKGAVRSEGFFGIVGTTGIKTARGTQKRPKEFLVEENTR
jgi:hypothetical protein